MWLFEYFFPESANLICRGTDISKYLIESLGIRDNESRLYIRTVLGHWLPRPGIPNPLKRFKDEPNLLNMPKVFPKPGIYIYIILQV